MMLFYLIFLNIAISLNKATRYVKVVWNGGIKEVITASAIRIRLKDRYVNPRLEDPSIAEYEDTGDGKFRLKYFTGYLCKKKKDAGVVICKNKEDKYTEWEMNSDNVSSRIKTEGVCLKRKGLDNKTGESGRHVHASSCFEGQTTEWSIEDVEIGTRQPEPVIKNPQNKSDMLTGNDNNNGSIISTIPTTVASGKLGLPSPFISKAESPTILLGHIY